MILVPTEKAEVNIACGLPGYKFMLRIHLELDQDEVTEYCLFQNDFIGPVGAYHIPRYPRPWYEAFIPWATANKRQRKERENHLKRERFEADVELAKQVINKSFKEIIDYLKDYGIHLNRSKFTVNGSFEPYCATEPAIGVILKHEILYLLNMSCGLSDEFVSTLMTCPWPMSDLNYMVYVISLLYEDDALMEQWNNEWFKRKTKIEEIVMQTGNTDAGNKV